jgi:AcrR family transcriptional regulator
MNEGRPERADAVRNRRAILAATEGLLATHRPQDISMEQVAAAAGVAKGTVFHRFGNRMGLMTALMIERAQALEEEVTSGPPPLGPGAPDRDRLLAFLAAIATVVSRNKSLLTELAYSAATEPPANEKAAHDRNDHPVYRFWHGHISSLIAAQRPDADAEMIAHILLGALHSEPVLAELATGGPDRLTAALHTIARAVLDADQRLSGSGEQRLPDRGPRFDRGVRVGGPRQVELLADERPDAAGRRFSQGRYREFPKPPRVGRPARQYRDLTRLGEFSRHRSEAPAGHPERAEASAGTEQVERGPADVPAYAVEDHVNAAGGGTHLPRPVARAVVNGDVGAEVASHSQFPLSAGQRHDPGARVAGQLD